MGGSSGFDPDTSINKMLFGVMTAKKGLRYKGFLGQSINERRDLPSVGHRSAMSRGIIIDDNGKMRCPAGTPNANQFTDINMSNCMVPSAETIANEAADAAKKAAEKAGDGFKRSRHNRNPKSNDAIPDASLAHADDDGFLTPKRVLPGNVVLSGADGKTPTALNTAEDSARHVALGGKLSDIPDEHLLSAIQSNIGSGRRFKRLGSGGGVNGMLRIEDTHTGALLGIKYNQSKGAFSGDDEPIAEIVGELFSEHMGMEPMPMRVVPRMRRGLLRRQEQFDGLALVTELAHNRHAGTIDTASDATELAPEDVTEELGRDFVRMELFDGITQNKDRHEGNFMISDDGTKRLILIDNSLAFPEDMNQLLGINEEMFALMGGRWDNAVAMLYGNYTPSGRQIRDARYESENGWENAVSDSVAALEDLREIDVEKLEEQINAFYLHIESLGGTVSPKQKKAFEEAIYRLGRMQRTNPIFLAERLTTRRPDGPPPGTLNELANAADASRVIIPDAPPVALEEVLSWTPPPPAKPLGPRPRV